MAYVVSSRHDSRIGFWPQAAWGTGAAAGAAFQELPNDPGAVFGQDIRLRRPNRSFTSTLGGQRMADERDYSNDTKGAAPTITTSGDVRKDDLAEYLYLVMQGVTEGGTTPYLKQFEFPATQPDFTVNGGMFGSVCGRHPTASTSVMLSDAIIRNLTLSVHPNNNQGRLQYSADWIGRGPLTHQFNPSGTWTRVDEEYFYFHDLGGVLYDAVDIDIFSWEITISNNAVPVGVEVGDTGKFATFALPKYTATGKFNMIYNSANYTLMHGQFESGTGTKMRIYWGNASPSADEDLRIDANSIITDVRRSLDDIHQMEVSWEAVTDVVTSGEDCDDHGLVIQLADASDRAW